MKPKPDEIDRLLEKLARKPGDVFPLGYTSSAPVLGGPIQGRVDGFSYLADAVVSIVG
jgi:hypothetical protein